MKRKIATLAAIVLATTLLQTVAYAEEEPISPSPLTSTDLGMDKPAGPVLTATDIISFEQDGTLTKLSTSMPSEPNKEQEAEKEKEKAKESEQQKTSKQEKFKFLSNEITPDGFTKLDNSTYIVQNGSDLWLVSGNYTAKIEMLLYTGLGDSKNAMINETSKVSIPALEAEK